MIVGTYFPRHGREKTEQLIQTLARKEKFENISDGSLVLTTQPLKRVEPVFRNVRKRESIVLEFDVDQDGRVIVDSVKVLESTSEKFVEPAKKAVAQWIYRPKFERVKFRKQECMRVAFTVKPPGSR